MAAEGRRLPVGQRSVQPADWLSRYLAAVDTERHLVPNNSVIRGGCGGLSDRPEVGGQRGFYAGRHPGRLLGLGHWLQENGEAIYGSTCWERAEALTQDGVPLRFTRNHGNLYVFLLERPEKAMVQIPDLVLLADSTVQLLGEGTDLEWQQQGKHLGVRLPDEYPESEAYVLRITDFLP